MTNQSTFRSATDDQLVVGVIGAGVMGRNIAQVVASYGHRVLLLDSSEDVLSSAIDEIRRSLRGRALMGDGGTRSLPSATLSRITATTEYSSLQVANFVIENIVESFESKRAVYRELTRMVGREVVIAANTSTFPISELAELVSYPDRLVGIHFMNPAVTKMLVEVIPGTATSPKTVEHAQVFLSSIGKRSVIVNDAPGFVSNRVLMLAINEAILVVENGTANAETVDEIFVGCFGHAMGPLATADLIGLDTILLSLESLKQRLKDAKFEPAALLKKLVGEGRLGRKVGLGFYSYNI